MSFCFKRSEQLLVSLLSHVNICNPARFLICASSFSSICAFPPWQMTIGKLQAAELVSEGRIDELEKAIKNSVTADVGRKMKDMTQGIVLFN